MTVCQCGECGKCKHRDYMREWYRRTHKSYDNPEKRNPRMLADYHRDPRKHRARMLLAQQVRRGIQTKGPCALCGAPETVGHHNDYSKPLEGTWLCRACHELIHDRLPATLGGVA